MIFLKLPRKPVFNLNSITKTVSFNFGLAANYQINLNKVLSFSLL